jgi:DNA mismatch repair protein MutL
MLVAAVQKRLHSQDSARRGAEPDLAPRPGGALGQIPLRPAGAGGLALRPQSSAGEPFAWPRGAGAEPRFAASGGAAASGFDPAVQARPARRDGGGFFGGLRVLGQVFGGYLVCQGEEQLVLIDQHAAHERVMFERLRDAQRGGIVPRQRLLVAEVVDLGPREAVLLRDNIERLGELGFEVEPHAGDAFAVRAVPALLGDSDAATLVRDLAEDLVEIGRSRRLDDASDAILSRLACHSAVRVGQNMSPDQVGALLRAMDHTDFSGHCPHGRPSFVALSRGDLERWFKRT